MRHPIRFAVAAALCCAGAFAASAAAQDGEAGGTQERIEAFDRTPRACVTLSRIDRTEIIDNQTILFYVGAREIYRNYLPRACPGLSRRDPILYETVRNELCDIDSITLIQRWGPSLGPGRSCQLGLFHPITPEEVEELKSGPHRSKIRVEPVEAERADLAEPHE